MMKPFPSPCVALLLILVIVQGADEEREWEVTIPHKKICAVTGSSVVMPCSFTHPPDLTVTKVFWLIDPQKGKVSSDLISKTSYKGRVQYFWNNDNNCTLKLSKLNKTDKAKYHARIETNKEEQNWQSKPAVQLTVTDLTVRIPVPVLEGHEVPLTCMTTCSNEETPHVIWRKNGQELPGEQTTNHQLNLMNVSPADEGNYACAFKDHREHPSKPVKLNVMFSPKNITVSVRPTDILMGGSVTLTCSNYAKPRAGNYTWFKVNESTPVGSGKQYSITNMSSEDGGQYYCEARNKHGADNSSTVSITVTDLGDHSPVVYVVTGVSVCGAAGLFCVLVWIRFHKSNTRDSKKDQDQDNVQSSNVNFLRSRETAGGAEDDVQYSTIQPRRSRETGGAQGDEVQYASVQFKKAGAAHGSPDQPEGELSVIYSTVETRA